MERLALDDLIDDMLWEIMMRLSYKERRVFASINKKLSSFYKRKKMGSSKLAGIDVYFGKKELLDEILSNRARIISITAPPSWGKTLFTFLIPFHLFPLGTEVESDLDRFVITVPNKLITLYKDEILARMPKALNLKDPSKSAIVIEDKCIGTHYDYFHPRDPTKDIALSSHNRVIIMPHLHVIRYQHWEKYSHLTEQMRMMTFIIDEAHIGSVSDRIVWGLQNRVILLSATPFRLDQMYNADFDSYQIPRDDIADLLPTNVFHSSQKPLEVLIRRNLRKRSKLLVICPDSKKTQTRINDWLEATKRKSFKVFKFSQSVQKINQFINYDGKAILIAEYSKIDIGFSVLADCAILDDCEKIGYERLYQVVSRLLRITNNNESITTTVRFGDGDTFFMRVKKALVSIKLNYDITIDRRYLDQPMRNAAAAVLKKLGINYEELSDIELVTVIAPNSHSLKKMYKDHGLLDSDLRRNILMNTFV